MSQPTAAPRFIALDSLRGALALFVVLFHLPVASHMKTWPLVDHGYLFVDYFFVLSGFVIAHAYGTRLSTLADAGRFMVRRLGRVWPLHAVILCGFLLLEFCRVWFSLGAAVPFTDDRTLEAFLPNLFLIQALGTQDRLSWNGPAWTLSVEVACYLAFAATTLAARRLPRWLPVAFALLICMGGALLVATRADGWMNTTWQYGWARGAYGFFLGWLVHRLWSVRPAPGADWLQPISLIAALAFVWIASGPTTVLASLTFAVTVWAFADDRATLARALDIAPLRLLGELSFAIYMVHLLAIMVLRIAFIEMGHMERRIDLGSVWLNDLLTIAFLGTVVLVAWGLHRCVETPARAVINGWLSRKARPDRAAVV